MENVIQITLWEAIMQLFWNVCIAWCMGVSMITLSHDAHRVAHMREYQCLAPYDTFCAYEDDIAQIKQQNGCEYDTTASAYTAYLHMFPWGVWQIITLLSAIGFAMCIPYAVHGRRLLATIACLCVALISGYATWRGYTRELAPRVIIASSCAPVHVGHAETYPVVGYIPHLDEVDMYTSLDDWIKVRYADTHGWIPSSCAIIINNNRYL